MIGYNVCNLSYPACNAHAPYYVIVACLAIRFFFTLSHKPQKKLLNIKLCFDFLYSFLTETFLILRRIQGDSIKNVQVFVWSTHCSAQTLTKLEFSPQIFGGGRGPLKYQIPWQSVQWEPQCFMRTGGQTDVTKLTVVSRNFGNAPKKRNPQVNSPVSTQWERKPVTKNFFVYYTYSRT